MKLDKLEAYANIELGISVQDLLDYSKYVRKWDGMPYKAISVEGGGTKGIFYAGALTRFEELGILKDVQYVAGASAGSQIASLIAAGFSASEISTIMQNAPWQSLFDDSWGYMRDMYRLWNQFGVYKGKVLEAYLDAQFAKKLGKPRATMMDLYECTGRTLKIAVCNVTQSRAELISHETYPFMPICVAVHASSAIPLLFSAVEWNGNVFVDGGLLNNTPAYSFPGDRTLSMQLENNEDFETSIGKRLKVSRSNNVIGHVCKIVYMVLNHAQASFRVENELQMTKNSDLAVHTLKILTGSAGMMDVDITPEKTAAMKAIGYCCADLFVSGDHLSCSR